MHDPRLPDLQRNRICWRPAGRQTSARLLARPFSKLASNLLRWAGLRDGFTTVHPALPGVNRPISASPATVIDRRCGERGACRVGTAWAHRTSAAKARIPP